MFNPIYRGFENRRKEKKGGKKRVFRMYAMYEVNGTEMVITGTL